MHCMVQHSEVGVVVNTHDLTHHCLWWKYFRLFSQLLSGMHLVLTVVIMSYTREL